ncbi:MAG TPA: response regulator [Alphaproteobacteria bacterium]
MSYDFSRLRMLLADDSPQMRAIIKTILLGVGVKNIIEAADGVTAIQKLKHNPVDIALIDWIMPGYSGIEVVRYVRRDGDSPNPYLPIIMVTGFSEKQRVMEARDAGATEFLTKPITAKGLISRILEVVERPRPFIRTKTYFGPCRRRRKLAEWAGIERRGTGVAAADVPATAAATESSPPKDCTKCEIIEPASLLGTQVTGSGGIDPAAITRAESTVAALKGEFEAAAQRQLNTLIDAFARLGPGAATDENLKTVYRIAHEIKGQGGTFGYTLLSRLADILCRYIRTVENVDTRAIAIMQAMVDAITTVISQRLEGDGGEVGREILRGLHQLTGDFDA